MRACMLKSSDNDKRKTKCICGSIGIVGLSGSIDRSIFPVAGNNWWALISWVLNVKGVFLQRNSLFFWLVNSNAKTAHTRKPHKSVR